MSILISNHGSLRGRPNGLAGGDALNSEIPGAVIHQNLYLLGSDSDVRMVVSIKISDGQRPAWREVHRGRAKISGAVAKRNERFALVGGKDEIEVAVSIEVACLHVAKASRELR